MKKVVLVYIFLLGFAYKLLAQVPTDSASAWKRQPTLNLSGFMDVFYVYDFSEPETGFRQPFFYNHNRHNEFNLNLGYVKLGVDHKKYRANLALQAGTYVNDNYSSEPGVLKNLFESNIGISLSRYNKLWLDAGIFASHIGFESAVSIENWTLTRSILAENSPYYLSGAKLTYNPNDTWELTALICNGWQRIKRVTGNSLPSFGAQIKAVPSEKITVNWSTFAGTDDPDTTRRIRYFSNFYGQFQFTGNFGVIAGFDIGLQQRVKSGSVYDFWFSPVIIAQFAINKNWKTALRAEYYQDKTGIIIPTGTLNGFQTSGISLNIDYSPVQNVMWRIEGRLLNSRDDIFQINSTVTNKNFIIGTSLAIRFSEAVKNCSP